MKTKLVWVLAGVALAACGDDDRPMVPVDAGPDGFVPMRDGGPIPVDAAPDAPITMLDGGDAGDVDATPPDGGGGPVSCSNGRRDGDETDVDCGGTTCTDRCEVEGRCEISSDCDSRVCIGRVCIAPSCTDGIRNGDETGADCGGPTCGGCAFGSACTMPSDCASGSCIGGFCVDAHCTNETQDADETDLDCGGASCGPCRAGDACAMDRDCTDSTCIDGFCRTLTCTNGMLDAMEVDVDCGGECPACDDGTTCTMPVDCLSGRCEGGSCASCFDGVQSGDEIGVDCGGPCVGCPSGTACTVPGDCASFQCLSGTCGGGLPSCLAILDANPMAPSGTYEIVPIGATPRRVYCDMTTDGGGWTLVGSTRDTTFDDAASVDYYADLATLTPVAAHEGIWSALRVQVGTRADIRFACRRDAMATTNDVDLSFYDNDWYAALTSSSSDASVCFHPGSGTSTSQDEAPQRRNNRTGATLPAGDPIGSLGFEGEDSCSDAGDFTVDFDAGGMDSTSDTDWGEDDSTELCGTSTSTGVWLVYVRAARCSNGMQDPGETAVDCGGTCGGCADGIACAGDDDCASNRCEASVCSSCLDGIQNGDETAIDCGGSCGGCLVGAPCTAGTQCASGTCTGGTCTSPVGYAASFETGPEGWTASTLWEHGVPAGDDIDRCGGGARCWVTNLDGDYGTSANASLTSPTIDLSGATTDPNVSLSIRYITENGLDGAVLESSIDGGATWARVGSFGTGTNWYTDSSDQTWTDDSGDWLRASNRLVGVAGQANVRLRVRFTSDTSVNYEGIGIDDVAIGFAKPNLAVRLEPSAERCGQATVVVVNEGAGPSTFFELTTNLDGTMASERVRTLLRPGESWRRDVTASMVAVSVSTYGDDDASNDSAALTTAGLPLAAGGYLETFEAGPGSWVAAGTNASWAWGTPTGSFISSADSGTRAWVTNPNGAYRTSELSYLVSPCFDFSSVTMPPTLSFARIFQTEANDDHAYVELSTDGGTTWAKLGTAASGTDWYTDLAGDFWDGTSGAAGAWTRSSHPLPGTAGEAEVRFRVVFVSDADTNRGDGFGVDDVRIVR